LVEGKNDQHVILALCKQHEIEESFNIIDCGGYDNLIDQFPIRFKASGIQTVGTIIDADDKLSQRWEAVKNQLIRLNFDVPHDLPTEGLIVSNNTQKAGVWIMPDNNVNGMLEDFMTFLIPEDDVLLPIVNSTLDTIESKGWRRYAACHRAKASIHTWLSWQRDPGTPMGSSITKRYLTTDVETCTKLIDWLKSLFSNDRV
jgi:hypothetical protein